MFGENHCARRNEGGGRGGGGGKKWSEELAGGGGWKRGMKGGWVGSTIAWEEAKVSEDAAAPRGDRTQCFDRVEGQLHGEDSGNQDGPKGCDVLAWTRERDEGEGVG